MNKTIFIFFALLGALHQVLAQGPLIDRKGTAYFFSEAPLEDIEATNTEVIGALDLTKGTLAVTMFMKGFHFDKSLMEEHFNENYIESEKFPRATFKGVISDFSTLDFTKSGKIEAEAKGEINIHGVTKPLTAPVTFEISANKLSAITVFNISIADFDIDIPRLVIQNIAEVVEVKASFNFTR
jgi:polyisoprenoid-binding protein YceI